MMPHNVFVVSLLKMVQRTSALKTDFLLPKWTAGSTSTDAGLMALTRAPGQMIHDVTFLPAIVKHWSVNRLNGVNSPLYVLFINLSSYQ